LDERLVTVDGHERSSNWISRYIDLQVQTTRLGLKALLIVGPPLLALAAYYLFAPWEVAYRQHGVTVLRAQVERFHPTIPMNSCKSTRSVRIR
jgi:hypothetical protein